MNYFYNMAVNFWCLLCWGGIIGWHSLLLILHKNPTRQFTNRTLKKASLKILKAAKAKCSIHYACPLTEEHGAPYIFMSNHQSLLDIPLIHASMLGTVRIPAKKELFKIPLLGRVFQISESIPVDRENPLAMADFFKEIKNKLSSGITLWIFPEGTRSATGKLLPFKAGCFRLAREVSARIVPVGIVNTRAVIPPGKFKVTRNQFVSIRVGNPIDSRDYPAESQKVFMNDVQEAIERLMNAHNSEFAQ